MKSFACLAVLTFIAVATADECNLSNQPMVDLPTTSGPWLNIFTDMVISCAGKISSWEFYSDSKGKIFLDVWRPTGDNYELIGKNEITTEVSGAVIAVDIALAEQISVQPGDVIGIHYPDGSNGKIIPYLHKNIGSADPVEYGLTMAQLMAFQAQNTQNDELPTGKLIAIATRTGDKRTPALNVNIDADTCSLTDQPLVDLPKAGGRYLNIFADMVVSCYGKVSTWEFYSDVEGTLFLDVWRPNGDNYELVGKNEVTTDVKNAIFTAEIAVADQISVQPGDVIGIHYPDGSEGNIIPYLTLAYGSADPVEFGLTMDQVIAYQNQDTQDPDLPVGKLIATSTRTDKKKTPALNVNINACPDAFSVAANKHILGGVAHSDISTLSDCQDLCSSMLEDECKSIDYDNKLQPWKDTRCWIHTDANSDHDILDLVEVDHHTRTTGAC